MQMVAANVPTAVLSTMKSPYGARVPYAGSPHGKAAAFTRRCLSSLTWGHDGPTMCARVRERIYACGCVCFLSRDSILLDFWAQSAVHMLLAALWMARVSVTVKPIGQDWEVWKARDGLHECVWQNEMRGGDRDKEGAMIQREGYLLSRIWCRRNPGSSFKMPPRLADQEWKIAAVYKLTSTGSHVNTLTPVHGQVAQCTLQLFVSSVLVSLGFQGSFVLSFKTFI